MIDDVLRDTFDDVLAAIITGTLTACPSETGLDIETIDALNAVASAVSTQSDIVGAVQSAHDELAKMFDGTHAREYWFDVKS